MSTADVINRENLYIFVFNVNDKEEDPAEIHQFISRSKVITSWWNYFPGVYFLEVPASEDVVTSYFYEKFPDISCFLIRHDKSSFRARMPVNAWAWLLKLSGDDEADFVTRMQERFSKPKKALK